MSAALSVTDEGSGPAVVLLHAFPCHAGMWQPQARSLVEAGHRVLRVDLPGFGGSPLLEAEPGLGAVADLVLATLEERAVPTCVLGGISLGGYVTMAMLSRRPDIARAVVLCDTRATADSEAARANRHRLAGLAEQAPGEVTRLLEQAVLPGLLGDTTRAERPLVVDEVRRWLADASAGAVAWYQRAMAERPDSLGVLGALTVPGLVVWGDEDALSPITEQEAMLDALDDGWLAVVEGAGHLSNVERPEAVSRILLDFCSGL